MKFKVSGVTSYKHASMFDGMVDYIGIPVSGSQGRGVPIGTARDIASMVSKSKPVLAVYRSTIPWLVETARRLDFSIIEYRVPVPSITTAILAEMLEPYGIRIVPTIVWGRGWRPEPPCSYSRALTRLANNIEYIMLESLEASPIPVGQIPGESCDPVFGVKGNLSPEYICSVAKKGINVVDLEEEVDEAGGKSLAKLQRILEEARKCGA